MAKIIFFNNTKPEELCILIDHKETTISPDDYPSVIESLVDGSNQDWTITFVEEQLLRFESNASASVYAKAVTITGNVITMFDQTITTLKDD